MATSSATEFRRYLGGAASAGEDLLVAALDQAKRHTIRDGIAEDHEAFSDLQMAYAGYLLEMRGVITVGTIQSKSIGDVSTTFAQRQGEPEGSFLSVYKRIKTQIFGFQGRFGA